MIFFLVTVMVGYSCTIELSRGDLDLDSEWTASTKNLKCVSYTMKHQKKMMKSSVLKTMNPGKHCLTQPKWDTMPLFTDVAKDLGEEVLIIHYHRKCRSLFTMKRELETLKRKATENITDINITGENSLPKRPSRRSSDGARVYHPVCIFVIKISL